MKPLLLGEKLDPKTRAPGGPLELAPSDLTTHGCIIGMTGSGKTGLGIVLIEECLRQGISVLALDPKGDLGNLLLLFPDLAAADFAAWIDPRLAARAGQTPAQAGEEARAQALEGLKRAGLAEADVRALRAGHDAALYTPGSSAGRPLALVASLRAPARDTPDDELRESVGTVAGSILSLVGLDADPVRSRDAVLVGKVVESAWRAGRDLTIADLIGGVVNPSFDRLGALPLETAYPAKERAQLANQLNNLAASTTFAGFLEGEPLDLDRMLGAEQGRPQLSIVSTAHLGDAERLFVTAILAERVRGWMRSQPGTSELRALFYLDEVLGYLPPTSLPPTKPPLLALLKQARAFGIGLVLATQNPVDLDYKALANMGAWMIGRLQTEQDQARLAEGLSSAVRAQGADPAAAVRLLGALEKRVFLLQDVHRKGPELMRSRYAMSYLRGPLTRADIARLTAARPRPEGTGEAAVSARDDAASSGRPAVPPWLQQRFATLKGAAFARPHLLVKAAVRYRVERGAAEEETLLRAFPLTGVVAAEVLEGEPVELTESSLAETPAADTRFEDLASSVLADRKAIEKTVRDRLPDRLAASLSYDPQTRLLSRPGETAEAFAARVAAASSGGKGKALADKIEARKRDLALAEQDLAGRKREKWVSLGGTVLTNLTGLLFGRKRTITGAGAVLSKNRMEDNAEARTAKLGAELAALQAERDALVQVDPGRFEQRCLVPAKADVDVLRIEIVWIG